VRRKHTAVLSDVHLSQAHPVDPDDPLWMRYRRAEYHPDAELSALVDRLLEERGREGTEDDLELVFNGDLFDFDAPWVKDGRSTSDEFPLTGEGCAAQVLRIMADHPGWFRAVARVLLAGHRVLFLSGNHDVELYWPAVRAAIREELVRLAGQEAAGRPEGAADLAARVRFRTWFQVTEDGIYLEHGSQYDHLNGVRYAMLPVTRGRDWIHPVVGKLAFKRTGSRMGYFNPYYEETFYLGLTGYLRHFFRFYAGRPTRHIFRVWFRGSLATAWEILRHRHREDWWPEARVLAQAETGASLDAIDATHALGVPSGEATMIPILRQLWLDRVALGALILVATAVAAALGGARAAGMAALASAALFVAYEVLTPKPDIRTYDSAPPRVKRLFDLHGVRAICMGHTHRPFSIWEDGRFHGNSGSWCPAFRDVLCTEPVLDGRPLLLLTTEGDEIHGGVFWWRAGALVADPAARPPPPPARRVAPGGIEAGDAPLRRDVA
jgi:UDP-2,3-diacylglucosamine pyrophosphatase LpxH